MSELRLRLRQPPEHTLHLAPLTPTALGALSRSRIPRLRLRYGCHSTALGEWFELHGATGAEILRVEGGSAHFEGFGAGLQAGELVLHGDAGALAGAAMRAGQISIHGNVGDYAGAGIAGGQLGVHGNAADHAGGVLPGTAELAAAYATGGLVWVRGNVQNCAGGHMRRGLLIVEGRSGPDCAARMQAGTIVVLGTTGARAALGMRRGTLVCGGRVALPVGFAVAGPLQMQMLRILFCHIARLHPHLKFFRKLGILAHRYTGDLSVGGVGEVLKLTRV